MPLPALLLPILAAVAPATDAPINITGHAWAPFISPMGEPFRARTRADDTLANWFRQADRNHDGMLTLDEMQADADRFFATLDDNHDGEIDPDELVHYEWEVAPDIQVMSRTMRAPGDTSGKKTDAKRGPAHGRSRAGIGDEGDFEAGGLQGAARYALLNIPEPVAAADTNFDRGVTLIEFRQAAISRFQLLDTKGQGRLTLIELAAMRPPPPVAGRHPKRERDAVDKRVGNPLPPGD
jgi:Ca2+-binding EF-hand superfamily protein